jgi:hypothetical protein
MLNNTEGHASFNVVGKIYSVVITTIKSNKEEMIQLRVVNKKGRYITILLFGNYVDQIKADIDLSTLKANDPANPWVFVAGEISEKGYERSGKNVSETTLIGKEVIIIGAEKTKVETLDFLNNMVDAIDSDPDDIKF